MIYCDGTIIVYCDGSCLGNPGPGGWGVRIERNNSFEHYSGGVREQTTNNKMELQAAIEALKVIGDTTSPITIITDSNYVVKGMSEWKNGWIKKQWKGVKNSDQWKQLIELSENKTVLWQWVKGHSVSEGNQIVDKLARDAALEAST